MYKQQSIGVVVPTYNEEANVGEVIDTVPDFVDRVYVVDDCSTDETWSVIQRHTRGTNAGDPLTNGDSQSGSDADVDASKPADGSATELTVSEGTTPRSDAATSEPTTPSAEQQRSSPQFVTIRHDENRGVGAAILTGYRRARRDRIDVTAVMAGDGQMDPAILDRMLDPVAAGEAGYAKGNRLVGRSYLRGMPTWRLFGNAVLTLLTRLASGYWGMSDPQNGYTAISLDVLDAIDLDDLHEEYGFANDLLVALNVHDVTVADVPMRAQYGDEESDIEYSRFVPKLSLLLLRSFWWRMRAGDGITRGGPVTLLYTGGITGLGVGSGRIARRFASSEPASSDADTESDVGRSMGLLAVGVTAVLAGIALDRRANADLVERLDPPDREDRLDQPNSEEPLDQSDSDDRLDPLDSEE